MTTRPDRIRFRTENGSIYEVNYQLCTWKREETTAESGTIRAEFGTLLSNNGKTFNVAVSVGCRCYLNDTSVLPGCDGHAVVTSRVTEILSLDPLNDGPEVDVIENEKELPGEGVYGIAIPLGGGFVVVNEPDPEFCLHCGAGVGSHRREGEGTCEHCEGE